MIAVACFFLYLAIKHGFEPLLLVPIAFGMLLVNIYPDIMLHAEDAANGTGGLLYYFYVLDEWSHPSVTDLPRRGSHDGLRTPDRQPEELSSWCGGPVRYLCGLTWARWPWASLTRRRQPSAIIGGADGPTSIFLAGKLQQTAILGPIAVAAYSYMALGAVIQPPVMKLLTTEKERRIKMEQLRPVSKLERILFPIIVTIVVCMILPHHSAPGWYAHAGQPVP